MDASPSLPIYILLIYWYALRSKIKSRNIVFVQEELRSRIWGLEMVRTAVPARWKWALWLIDRELIKARKSLALYERFGFVVIGWLKG